MLLIHSTHFSPIDSFNGISFAVSTMFNLFQFPNVDNFFSKLPTPNMSRDREPWQNAAPASCHGDCVGLSLYLCLCLCLCLCLSPTWGDNNTTASSHGRHPTDRASMGSSVPTPTASKSVLKSALVHCVSPSTGLRQTDGI